MLARPDAYLAFPFGVGKILIGDGIDIKILGHVGHAVAKGQGKPVVVAAAQVGRNGLLQCVRFHGLRYAGLDQVEQIADVDGHEEVRRRFFAFGANTLDQPILDEDGIDLHSGVLGVLVEQRLYKAGFACGIQIHVGGMRSGGHGRQRDNASQREAASKRARTVGARHGRFSS